MTDTVAIQDRIGELCHQFRLPTMGAQSVARFTAAGHGGALEILLEVLEQEAEDRRQRRIGRLRTAPPPDCRRARPGKASSMTVSHWLCGSNWTSWPRAASSTAASTCWPSGYPAPARPTPCAPWDTGWWSRVGRCCLLRPTVWCRTSCRQAGPGPFARTAQARQLRLPAPR